MRKKLETHGAIGVQYSVRCAGTKVFCSAIVPDQMLVHAKRCRHPIWRYGTANRHGSGALGAVSDATSYHVSPTF